LIKEVLAEIASMRVVGELSTKEYLITYIIQMFGTPLRQTNEARPSEPLIFLAAYSEAQALKD
jgi:hypothetical protein